MAALGQLFSKLMIELGVKNDQKGPARIQTKSL